MRIVTFLHDGKVQYGSRIGDRVRVHPAATSAVDLAVNLAKRPVGDEVALSEVALLAPCRDRER